MFSMMKHNIMTSYIMLYNIINIIIIIFIIITCLYHHKHQKHDFISKNIKNMIFIEKNEKNMKIIIITSKSSYFYKVLARSSHFRNKLNDRSKSLKSITIHPSCFRLEPQKWHPKVCFWTLVLAAPKWWHAGAQNVQICTPPRTPPK